MNFFMFLPLNLAAALPPALVGFLLAYFLAKRTFRPVLRNQRSLLALGATWFIAGILNALSLYPNNALLAVALCCALAFPLLYALSRNPAPDPETSPSVSDNAKSS